MLSFAHGRVLPINGDLVRNKLNISDEIFVRFLNFTERNVLALNCRLLCLVKFFIGHLSHFDFATSSNDSVLG